MLELLAILADVNLMREGCASEQSGKFWLKSASFGTCLAQSGHSGVPRLFLN